MTTLSKSPCRQPLIHIVHKQFILTGLDSGNKVWVEVILRIDWDKHQLAVERGYEKVTVGASWENSTAPEVEEAIIFFCQKVSRLGLRPTCFYRYKRNVDRAFVDRELGLIEVSSLNWAGDIEEFSISIRELDELGIEIRYVED